MTIQMFKMIHERGSIVFAAQDSCPPLVLRSLMEADTSISQTEYFHLQNL